MLSVFQVMKKIDNRDQTDATMLNGIYEKAASSLLKPLLKICSTFQYHTMQWLIKMLSKTNDVLGDQQIYVEQPMEHVDAEGNKDIDLLPDIKRQDSNNALA